MKRSVSHPSKRLKLSAVALSDSDAVGKAKVPHLDKSAGTRKPSRLIKFPKIMAPVVKSPNDKREYRVLKLENGLTALLISDPSSDDQKDEDADDQSMGSASSAEGSDEEMDTDDEEDDGGSEEEDEEEKSKTGSEKLSAAALCIGVGSFSDPPDIPGLSHFLEHMVFMGSEKYPDENAFDAYLKKHGGSSNAYTDCERTVFYFDVKREFFDGALDRFAQFFINPLLKEGSVDREIEAVDSEFAQALPSDQCRIEQLLCSTAHPDNPMKKFMWGNTLSLKTRPTEQNINVYDRLREHHRAMYSSHYMTLALQSREPLDDLQSMVTEIFSSVVKNDLPQPTFYHLKDPFDTQHFRKLYKVVPMKKTNKVIITWSLPHQLEMFRSKPLYYIDWLIGHEGAGSVLSYLKKKVWAFDLVAGNNDSGVEHNTTHAQFNISVSLTEAGMDNVLEVIKCVFEYLAMLRDFGPQERIFNEIKTIEDNNFAWKEQIDPIDYVDTMCVNMQRYPTEEYITGELLLTEYKPEAITNCLSHLTPDRANIMFVSNRFSDSCGDKEEWFQTPYSVEDIPTDWITNWSNLPLNPIFHLPAKNEYIATDFSILKDDCDITKFPKKITDTKRSVLWYKKDDKFNVPKVFTYFYIRNSKINSSPKLAAVCDLYIAILLHNLSEVAYAADVAQLNYKVRIHESGILLKCSGFNHKIHRLFETMVDYMAAFDVDEELFDAMKKEVQKVYHNCYIKPGELVGELRLSILQHEYWSMVERQNVLGQITRKDVINFAHQELFKQCSVEGLVMGNFTVEKALGLESYLLDKLNVIEDQVTPITVTKIPSGSNIIRVKGFNAQDENSMIVNYYQHGQAKLHQYSLHNLLMMKMEEPCFDILRTREQLGYEVYNSLRNTNGILGFIIVVKSQANKFSLDVLDEKIESFLEEFGKMIDDMSQEDFDAQVSSLITLKQCEDTRLKEQVDRYWSEITSQTYSFNVLDREVAELRSFTLEEFKQWCHDHLPRRSSCSKLSIQVEGNAEAASKRENSEEAEVCELQENPKLRYTTPAAQSSIQDIQEFKHSNQKFPPSKIV